MSIESLEKRVAEASQAYYGGEPIMSDEEFDLLLDELTSVDQKNNLMNRVGHGYVPKGKREEKHLLEVVGSLPKTKDIKDLNIGDVVSPKLDGLSLVAYYEGGVLTKVLTRGDGKVGLDVTNKIAVPHEVHTSIMAVRGEGVIGLQNFEKHLSEDYANPRNAVAGIVNADNSPHLKYVEFIAFKVADWMGHVYSMDSGWEMCCGLLKSSGFKHVPSITLDETKLSSEELVEFLDEWRTKFGLPTDGVVVNGKLAFKFKTEEVEAVIKNVDWKLSSLGRLIPVIEVEQVDLCGTKVSRASAYHAKYVFENKLGRGARVVLTKANEIIPHIVRVIEGSKMLDLANSVLSRCPQCDSFLEWDGVHQVCSGNCNKAKERLKRFIKIHADVKHMGDAMLDKILEVLGIESLDTLMMWDEICSPSMFVGLTLHEVELVREMFEMLNGSLDRNKLLESLNLPGCGGINSKALAPLLDEVLDSSVCGEERIFRSGKYLVQSKEQVAKEIEANLGLIRRVYECFNWAELEEQTEVKIVTLTGKMSMSRKEIVAKMSQHGYVEGPVSKGGVLVCADKNSTSSKMQKACKVGARIMTEEEFWNMIEGK